MSKKDTLEDIVKSAQRISIRDCQEIAKKLGFDSMEFYLNGQRSKLKAKWINAYFGFFSIDGKKGFFISKDFYSYPIRELWCSGLHIPRSKKTVGRERE